MTDTAAALDLRSAAGEIQRLGVILSRLNFFRAAGVTWSELRHSDFLAFLMSPTESHKLKDRFLKRFLREVRAEHPAAQNLPSPDELSMWTLDDTQVSREKDHIDILLLNPRLGFAVIIENKTGSQEHGDQLLRYWQSIARESRRTPKIIGLFLSPSRAIPTDPRFLPISYRTVRKALENVRSSVEVSEFLDLKVLLRHYACLIEEEFMDQPDASGIAWDVYRKHPKAIEFLNSNSPNQQMKNEIRVLLSETDGCAFELERAYELSFVFPEWRKDPTLITGPIEYSAAWLFWFDGFDKNLVLWLGIDPQSNAAVGRLTAIAKSNQSIFPQSGVGKMVGGWPTVWSREFLSPADLGQLDREQTLKKLRERWQAFRDHSLPALRNLLATSSGA